MTPLEFEQEFIEWQRSTLQLLDRIITTIPEDSEEGKDLDISLTISASDCQRLAHSLQLTAHFATLAPHPKDHRITYF